MRRAGRRDLDQIQGLWLALREELASADARLAPALNSDKLVAEHRAVVLADPRTAFFVAEERGELHGFLHARIEPNDPVYEPERFGRIADLYVVPERRRAGVAGQLVDYCADWFRSHNLSQYRADAPEACAAAQAFFASRGAETLTRAVLVPLADDAR